MRLLTAKLAVVVASLARGGGGTGTPDVPADDVKGDGACGGLISQQCADVPAGNGRVAHCLYNFMIAAARRREQSSVPKACNTEVGLFLYRAMTHDVPESVAPRAFWVEPVPGMTEACEQDVARECPGLRGPKLVACLKAHRDSLAPACSQKVFRVQEMQARDVKLDVDFYRACEGDLDGLEECCRAPPEARKACLASPAHRGNLSNRCKEAVFKRQVEESEDLRLHREVLTPCEEAIAAKCADVPFGKARMIQCLWDNVVEAEHETHAYDLCSEKVNELVGLEVSNYRLDFRVRTRCADDILQHCQAEKVLVDNMPITNLLDGQGGQVLTCLKEHFRDLWPPCGDEMARVARIQASRADFDPEIRRHCAAEVQRLCGDQPPSETHMCLRRHYEELGAACRQVEALQSKVEVASFVMRPKTAQLCKQAADLFCGGVQPRGKLRCLQDHMGQPSFHAGCKSALTADMEANNHDWQLRLGISSECQEDAHAHCERFLATPGTAVLDCLAQVHAANGITQLGCREEIGRYLKTGAEDIRVLPEAYEACKEDVRLLCPTVPPGQGRVHACLVEHRANLSQRCAAMEFQNQAAQSRDIRMSPEAQVLCGPVMGQLCPGVDPGGGRMWACLYERRSSPDMPRQCADVLSERERLKQSEFFLNPSLSGACQAEAARLCPQQLALASRRDFGSNGGVISCLIERRGEVRDADCARAVGRKQAERVASAAMDPGHAAACRADIEAHCRAAEQAAVRSRGTQGLVHLCLQEHFLELSDACAEKEADYMIMASEDTRLNLPVGQHCGEARRRWCGDTPDGEGQTTLCLLRHMHEERMETSCRQALEGEQNKLASFHFVPLLERACSGELEVLESTGGCERNDDPGISFLMDCLTRSPEGVRDGRCRDAVRGVLQLQSADLRARPGMLGACGGDLERLCPGVQLGAARGHECLRENVARIQSGACRELVLQVQAADSASASLNFAVRTKCANEVKTFCPHVEPGNARVLACLGLSVNATGFGGPCLRALRGTGAERAAQAALRGGAGGPLGSALGGWAESRWAFAEEHGSILLGGTLGFVVVLTAWVSWCVLRGRAFGKAGYQVVVPKSS